MSKCNTVKATRWGQILAFTCLLACGRRVDPGIEERSYAASSALVSSITYGPLDCLPVGLVSGGAPSLPFYQPTVGLGDVDTVVMASGGTANQFQILDNWDGPNPSGPLSHVFWDVGDYTSFDVTSDYQRAQNNTNPNSSVQVEGAEVGFWINSQDSGNQPAPGGSNSLQATCGYSSAPYPVLFPTSSSFLDISFDTTVALDGSAVNTPAHAQTYFQMIMLDTRKMNQFSISWQVYNGGYCDTDPPPQHLVHGDGTGELGGEPLVELNIGCTNLVTAMPDSDLKATVKAGNTFPTLKHVHLQMSQEQFNLIRYYVGQYNTAYSSSTPTTEYQFTLFSAQAEAYDPCTAVPPTYPNCPNSAWARLGTTFANVQLRTKTSNWAAYTPSAFDTAGGGEAIVYNNGNQVLVFSTPLNNFALQNFGIGSTNIAGPPAGYFAGVMRIVSRDASSHIEENYFYNNVWNTWDMTGIGAVNAYSDPKPFVDSAGVAHVIYRDIGGNVQDVYMDAGGWHHRDVTQLATPAQPGTLNTPTGFAGWGGGAANIVYRDGNNHPRDLYLSGGVWMGWDMMDVGGSVLAYSDPKGYNDASGYSHVVYRDINGHVHELYGTPAGWAHWDVTALAGGAPAIGNPTGYLAGSTYRIVYQGIDHHVHELAYNSPTWVHTDLMTTARGAAALTTVDDPSEFMPSDGVPRIHYIDASKSIHELRQTPYGWIDLDM